MEKDQLTIGQNKAEVSRLITDKIEYMLIKYHIPNNTLYIQVKGKLEQEDITIMKTYVPKTPRQNVQSPG